MARRTCSTCDYAPVLKNAKLCSWCATDKRRPSSIQRFLPTVGRVAALGVAGYYAVGLFLLTR